VRAISLFTNCGAGDVGFRRAGFRFDVLAELDTRRLAVAQLNHPEASTVPGDLRMTWGLVRDRYRERAGDTPPDLLAACPPCQGVSSARGGRGKGSDPDAGSRDGRNLLVVPIANVAMALRPRIIVVENVTAFLTRQVRHPDTSEPISAAQLLIASLEPNYEAFPVAVDLADFGVPQYRRRCFITFIRRDEPALERMLPLGLTPYPRPTHGVDGTPHVSLQAVLRKMQLPPLDAKSARSANDPSRPLHQIPLWNERRYAMVAAIRAHSGRSAWQNGACPACHAVVASEDAARCPACSQLLLRPIVQERDGTWRLIRGFHSSSYRRMASNRPASTVTTASGHLGSDRTIHPWENRVLSPLECAELQTIPSTFIWGEALDKFGSTFIRQMIGEAVPPHFTEQHGQILANVLDAEIDQTFLPAADARCVRARARLAAQSGVKEAQRS